MRERVRGYTDAALEDAAASGRLAESAAGVAAGRGRLAAAAAGVAAVRDLVARSEELGEVLADPGVPSHARRGVLTDLAGGRIDDDALRLVLFPLDADRPADYAEDLTWIAARAAAAADGLRDVGTPTLGRHGALERSDGYAACVLEGVRGDAGLSELEDELFRFERAIDASPELAAALSDRDLPPVVRGAVVHDLLAGRASDQAVRLATYLTRIGRPRDYVELLQATVARIGEEARRRVAVVRAAVAPTPDQEQRLSAALSRIVGQPVDVRVTVDGGILGGFVATIGDTVVDASVRHRLESLRERLARPEASPTT
ncbi:MAG: F0F1 ATP synthase subunit delta [Acidimicrobiales bacterium]